MDSWQEHLRFGLVFELIFIPLLFLWKNWYYTTGLLNILILIFQILVVIVLSPLIMDLDHKLGKLREVFTFLGLSIGMIGVAGHFFGIDLTTLMVLGIIVSTTAYMLCYTTHHRGYTHTILFAICYSMITAYVLGRIDLGILAFIGGYSHLLGDKIPFRISTFQKGIN